MNADTHRRWPRTLPTSAGQKRAARPLPRAAARLPSSSVCRPAGAGLLDRTECFPGQSDSAAACRATPGSSGFVASLAGAGRHHRVYDPSPAPTFTQLHGWRQRIFRVAYGRTHRLSTHGTRRLPRALRRLGMNDRKPVTRQERSAGWRHSASGNQGARSTTRNPERLERG